jgi:hypothetical protein
MKGADGIHELGFKAEGRQYRLLVKFDGVLRIVILCGCYHKQSRWTPSDAPKTATDRARMLSQGKATRRERTIEDDF